MLIKCINKKCLHKWDYKGKSNSYISCPKCSYRFKIQRGIEEHNKTMLTYPHNIVNNIPRKIVKEKPKTELSKIIKRPKTEFIEKKKVEEFDNLSDFNLAVLETQLKNKDKNIKEFKSPVIEFQPEIKLCEKHKLSAKYDPTEKKWLCKKCLREKIDDSIKIKVKCLTENLGSVREVRDEVIITPIPFKNKVGVVA